MFEKKIGVITIGQTPRPDIINLVWEILGKDYQVLMKGALDDLKIEDIPEFKDNEYLLMTSILDGKGEKKEVKVTREFLVPIIQEHILELEKYVIVIIIWCAGRFPEFKSKAYVIRPSVVLKGVIEAILEEGRLGVLYPSPLQLIWAEPEWKREGVEVYADAPGCDNSQEKDWKFLASRLADKNLDLILLNCTGFGFEMKESIRKITKTPVIQANALALRVVKELFY